MGTKGPVGMERASLLIEKLKEMKARHGETVKRLEDAGVYFVDKDRCIISPEVEIGENTVIYPDVIIEGNSKLGKGCIIHTGSRIKDSKIGDFCEIQNVVILESEIGNNVSLGPFAYIRPESVIGDNVKIGDFVEIKKAKIDKGTKVSHLTYIGDAIVGKEVNFGCGTVVVNYDGKTKNITEVGDYSFIGCNTNLVAPVKLGKNVFTAAGTTVTENVNDGCLVIGRSKQEVKEGWVDKKGLKKGE